MLRASGHTIGKVYLPLVVRNWSRNSSVAFIRPWRASGVIAWRRLDLLTL